MRYQHNLYTAKSTFSGLQFCRKHYGSILVVRVLAYLNCGISSLHHSANLILVHLIPRITSSQSPPSLSPSITFSQILSFIVTLIFFRTAFTDLNLCYFKGALAFVCLSFFFFIFFSYVCQIKLNI